MTFNNVKSYFKAIGAAFVEIKTPKFTKKVQIDPFLEDSPCSICQAVPGPYFCRELVCFRYFCRSCWQVKAASWDAQNPRPPLCLTRFASASRKPHAQIIALLWCKVSGLR